MSTLRQSASESLETVELEPRPYTFLYADEQRLYLSDPLTFDTLDLPLDTLPDAFGALAHIEAGQELKVLHSKDKPVLTHFPRNITCSVSAITEAGTLSNTKNYVMAVLPSGLKVQVPSVAVQPGDKIVIDSQMLTFVSRVNVETAM